MMKKTAILALAASILVSCVNTSIDEGSSKLLESQDITLMVGSDEVVTYKPETYQIGFNVKNGRYWVCNDKMDEFYIVEIVSGDLESDATPNVVKANIFYSTETSPVSTLNGISLEVLKSSRIENLTRYYLYSKSDALGVIIARE